MERLFGKIVYGSAGARDRKALQYSIEQHPANLTVGAMKSSC
jgi:hypothetical protein